VSNPCACALAVRTTVEDGVAEHLPAEDGSGRTSKQLLWSSRLLRDRAAYESRYGAAAATHCWPTACGASTR
jgi:hypothetical protein